MSVEAWSETVWLARVNDDPGFAEDLQTLTDRSEKGEFTRDVVIDMSGLTHINSSNLSALLRLRKALIDQDARLRLAAPPDSVWAVFMTTGLEKVFEFSEDVMIALTSLQLNE